MNISYFIDFQIIDYKSIIKPNIKLTKFYRYVPYKNQRKKRRNNRRIGKYPKR